MYAIYGNIYHQYTPFMLVSMDPMGYNIPSTHVPSFPYEFLLTSQGPMANLSSHGHLDQLSAEDAADGAHARRRGDLGRLEEEQERQLV